MQRKLEKNGERRVGAEAWMVPTGSTYEKESNISKAVACRLKE